MFVCLHHGCKECSRNLQTTLCGLKIIGILAEFIPRNIEMVNEIEMEIYKVIVFIAVEAGVQLLEFTACGVHVAYLHKSGSC